VQLSNLRVELDVAFLVQLSSVLLNSRALLHVATH
jgi:hypothetical protein